MISCLNTTHTCHKMVALFFSFVLGHRFLVVFMLLRHLLAMQTSSRDIEKDNIGRFRFTSFATWNRVSLLSKFEYKYNDRLLQYA